MKDYKIRIPDKETSRLVQEAAFKMGYIWYGDRHPKLFNGHNISFLFLSDRGDITYATEFGHRTFDDDPSEEIHWQDFIKLSEEPKQTNKKDEPEEEMNFKEGDRVVLSEQGKSRWGNQSEGTVGTIVSIYSDGTQWVSSRFPFINIFVKWGNGNRNNNYRIEDLVKEEELTPQYILDYLKVGDGGVRIGDSGVEFDGMSLYTDSSSPSTSWADVAPRITFTSSPPESLSYSLSKATKRKKKKKPKVTLRNKKPLF